MTRYSNLWLSLLCLALTALPGQAQTHYRVSFPEATQNRIQVEAHYLTGGEDQVELFLPVWTPGVYAVLNYSQRVDQLRATGENGQPLRLQPLSQSRWRVDCEGQSEITLFYRLKGGDRPSTSGNYVDAGKAVLQGAATFISPVTPVQPTFEVTVELPAAWESVICSCQSGSWRDRCRQRPRFSYFPFGAGPVYESRYRSTHGPFRRERSLSLSSAATLSWGSLCSSVAPTT